MTRKSFIKNILIGLGALIIIPMKLIGWSPRDKRVIFNDNDWRPIYGSITNTNKSEKLTEENIDKIFIDIKKFKERTKLKFGIKLKYLTYYPE